jgi:ribose 1,5-bisphosphate isomerase
MKKQVTKIFKDIKSIKIQGATNIALAVGRGLKIASSKSEYKTAVKFKKEIREIGKYLLGARATEPMAENVFEFVSFQLKKNKSKDVKELKKVVKDSVEYFFSLVEKNDKKITKNGEKLIKFGDKVFTHCHSSSVIKVLRGAKSNKKRFEVFQTETRPLYQGHKTARELAKFRIKDTLVVDSSAAYLISKVSGKAFEIDKLIIGCDAISRDGSCVNKVGSFGLAMTAFLNKIPVYIATQSLKINEDAKNIKAIKIEQRNAREVWNRAPKGLKIYNPAFDRVPAEFITGYICEFGVVKPKDLYKKIKNQYTWIK